MQFVASILLVLLVLASPFAKKATTSTGIVRAAKRTAMCIPIGKQKNSNNTATTHNVEAAKTGNDCKTNACAEDGGCAYCVKLNLQIPLEAKILAVHCYTNAHYPKDFPMSDLHEVRCTEDNAWSIFDSPVIIHETGVTVVGTTFHNRSSDRDRVVRLDVDWE